jgi:hypothetical protein
VKHVKSIVCAFALVILCAGLQFAHATTEISPGGPPVTISVSGFNIQFASSLGVTLNGVSTSFVTAQLGAMLTSTTRQLTVAAKSGAPSGTYTINIPTTKVTSPITIPVIVFIPITGVAVSPSSITGGSSADGTVSLGAAAPAAGAQVTITSNTVQATVGQTTFASSTIVTIPSGQTQGTFKVQTSSVTATLNANLTATLDGKSSLAPLQILPALALTGLTFSPTSGKQGTIIIGTVVTNIPVASDTVVSLQRISLPTGDPAVTLAFPPSVTIPARTSSAGFSLTIGPVFSAGTVKIGATLNGLTQSATIQVASSTSR